MAKDEDKANILNTHFIKKVKTLRARVNGIIAADPLEKLRKRLGPNVPKFEFSEVRKREVKQILKRMKK